MGSRVSDISIGQEVLPRNFLGRRPMELEAQSWLSILTEFRGPPLCLTVPTWCHTLYSECVEAALLTDRCQPRCP